MNDNQNLGAITPGTAQILGVRNCGFYGGSEVDGVENPVKMDDFGVPP